MSRRSVSRGKAVESDLVSLQSALFFEQPALTAAGTTLALLFPFNRLL